MKMADHTAPPERLAALRIAVGVFVLVYLVGRSPVFVALADRTPADFDGVGILTVSSGPLPGWMVIALIAVTLTTGVAATLGWRYRPMAIVFAVGLLVLTTLRSSWGQLLHFENLMVLQVIVLAPSPAADAWSLDARRTQRTERTGRTIAKSRARTESVRYGWPIAVAGLVTVVTYVITGIAKLRYGGVEWIDGDTLRNHIAYSAARLDLIGGTPPWFGEFAVRQAWVLPVGAFVAVVVELGAPIVYVGRRTRNAWVGVAWLMHIGIFLTMAVGFPSPIFGVAFAPFFALERTVDAVKRRIGRPTGVASVG